MSGYVIAVHALQTSASDAFEEALSRLMKGPSAPVVSVVDFAQARVSIRRDVPSDAPVVVVISPAVAAPLAVARALSAERADAYFVFVVDPRAEADLRHATVYAAPPGGRWTIRDERLPDLDAQILASLRIASQQRRFRSTVERVSLQITQKTEIGEPEYRRLVASDHYLANLLRHAHDAIVALSSDGDIVSWNAAAEAMLRAPSTSAVGRPFRDFFHTPAAVDDALRRVASGEHFRCDLFSGTSDSPSVADAVFTPTEYRNGVVVGMVVIMRDVSAQRVLEAQARDANRRKDEFLAMLAHELRNPLAPIRNAAEMLLLVSSDDPRVAWAGEMISRQARHMTALLSDLLDVSRVTRGSINLNRTIVSPDSFVARAIEQVRGLIDRKQQRLTVTMGPALGDVFGDKDRLTQVLANLLNNAAKYTLECGHIELTVDSSENEISFTVTDDGIGIDAHLLPQVFDLFTQAERSLDRTSGGLGIGLALVKSLVEMHGGTVKATSAGLGCGSSFTVLLPRYHELRDTDSVGDTTVMRNTADRQEILVVDDNDDAAMSLAAILELDGHKVSVANSGIRALELASQMRFNIFLLDIGMPDMDGYVLASALRMLPGSKHALIIAHTGYGQPEDVVRSHEMGFDYHLTKPADPEHLLRLIAGQ